MKPRLKKYKGNKIYEALSSPIFVCSHNKKRCTVRTTVHPFSIGRNVLTLKSKRNNIYLATLAENLQNKIAKLRFKIAKNYLKVKL